VRRAAARAAGRAISLARHALAPGGAVALLALPIALASALLLVSLLGPGRVTEHEILLAEAVDRFFRREVTSFQVPPEAETSGPEDAAVHVVLFSDFECPYCRRLPALLEPFASEVRVTFVHFPLDAAVNPHTRMRVHPHAAVAARGAILAARLGAFGAYHDALMEEPRDLQRERIEAWLVEHGGEPEAVEAALAGNGVEDVLRAHMDLGGRLGVRGTPTVYINGRRMSGFQAAVLPALLEREVRRARREAPTGRNIRVSSEVR
jgi:predicted DsbA family dithiol-disulfide isomerase